MNVLVVDDMADIRLMLRTLLQFRPGTDRISEATDGASAISAAREERPDLIILDRHMEPVGGDEALPALRQIVGDAVIIVYSAFVSDPAEHAGLIDLGADAVVYKGSLFADLEQAIAAAVANRTGA
ncbi:MAG TPA: response regulator [Acidimicrobiales bacterium]|nr:response regulator [Acidimicrobiales bacterium]